MQKIDTGNTHLVAFIDILGFKNMVNDYFSARKKESFSILENALKAAEDYAINFSKNYLKQYQIDFIFKQFSDCVSISMPVKGYNAVNFLSEIGCFLNIVRLYQFILLDNEILVRGGISIGPHLETNSTIFSEALIQSYKLETEKAIYPRILVDNKIIAFLDKALKELPMAYNDFYQFYGCNFIKDWDDEVFLSPFGIGRETRLFAERVGFDQLKNVLDHLPQLKEKGIDANDFANLIKDDINDVEIMKRCLEKVNKYLEDNLEGKPESLLKYKWLKQFIMWSINGRSSKIRFQQHYKKPKKRP